MPMLKSNAIMAPAPFSSLAILLCLAPLLLCIAAAVAASPQPGQPPLSSSSLELHEKDREPHIAAAVASNNPQQLNGHASPLSQETPPPPPYTELERVNEPMEGCDPIPTSSSGRGYEIQHLSLVNSFFHSHRNRTSFLFRSASPTLDNFRGDLERQMREEEYESRFLYEDLLHGMRREVKEKGVEEGAFPEKNEEIYLIAVSLLRPTRPSDLARMRAEQAFFAPRRSHRKEKAKEKEREWSEHTRNKKGEFIAWPIYGSFWNASSPSSRHSPSDAPSSHRARVNAERIRAWKADVSRGHMPMDPRFTLPDDLPDLLQLLQYLLEEKRAPHRHQTVVVFVHCYCGSDRTGEVIAAWNLFYNGLDWPEAQQANTIVADRPMGCKNYLAAQWTCLWLEGQRRKEQQQREEQERDGKDRHHAKKEHGHKALQKVDLGCERNQQCTLFETARAKNTTKNSEVEKEKKKKGKGKM